MRLEGCKEFLLVAMRYEWPNGTQIAQIRQDDRELFLVLVRSQILKFAVKREFWLRIAGVFAEKARVSPLLKT